MKIFLILLCLFVVLLILFFWRAKKGIRRPMSQLRRPIEDLLLMDLYKGYLILDHEKSEKFIQFKAVGSDKQSRGIVLGFPLVSWSSPYYQAVEEYLRSKKVPIKETNAGCHVLEADFGTNTEQAFHCTKYIFEEIFGTSENDRYFVNLNEGAGG